MQSERAYHSGMNWTTESPSQPGTSIYYAPMVTQANTIVTITVTAYDNVGHLIASNTVVILVSP